MAGSEQVTMADVAQRAGVSRSAVSAAFSERASTAVIRDETRRHILATAKQLGYRPNLLSRSFIKQRSFLIGFVGREVFFVFTLETIKGIEEVLDKTDYSLITYYHGDWSPDQSKHLNKCSTRRVDGMIIVGAPERPGGSNHRVIRQMQDSGVPVVQLGRRIFPGVPVAMANDHQMGYAGTRHLIDLGHRRIAHVTYSTYLDERLPGTDIEAHDRYAGYRQAMLDAGLEPHVVTFDRSGYGPGMNDYERFCAQPVEELTAKASAFTAATTFNDYTCIGLIQTLTAAGLKVPEDMSLVGCDNVEAAAICRPTLTTLRPSMAAIGQAAAKMILDLMEGKAVQDTVLDAELIRRQSSGPVPN